MINEADQITTNDELIIKPAGIKEIDQGNGIKIRVAFFTVWKRQIDGTLAQWVDVVNGETVAWVLTSQPIQIRSSLVLQ